MSKSNDRLMREDEVGELLEVSKFTLQSWRRPELEKGPRWVNVGSDQRRSIRYRESDVQAWIAGLPVDGGDLRPA